MAQKSLPILNKVNVSMIWYSTYYFHYYKWLSSQSLYLLYFFNKLSFYLEFFFFNLFWTPYYNQYLDDRWKTYSNFNPLDTRFLKPMTSYLIKHSKGLLVCNLFYKTSLSQFQAFNNQEEWEYYDFIDECEKNSIQLGIYYK